MFKPGDTVEILKGPKEGRRVKVTELNTFERFGSKIPIVFVDIDGKSRWYYPIELKLINKI